MPAPATFAITVNSSRVGFRVSFSTLRYSLNFRGTGDSLFSNNIVHIHSIDNYKSYPKIIAVCIIKLNIKIVFDCMAQISK